MNRDTFEVALVELDALLARPDTPEDKFQQWFENNPIVLQVLGYVRHIPHPVIRDVQGNKWIPDFLVQAPNSNWLIFELKRADERIIPEGERRITFYKAIDTYIAQCHEYVEQLDVPEVRVTFEGDYSVHIHKDPKVVLVVGRSSNLDRDRVRSLATRHQVDFFTYDDVRSALYGARALYFAEYDKASGYAVNVILRIGKANEGASNHIIDIGGDCESNRVTVTIDPRQFLNVVIRDSNGGRHSARSVEPLTDDQFGKAHALLISVGLASKFNFVSVELDRRYIADVQLSGFPFVLSKELVLGSDFDAQGAGWFEIQGMLLIALALSLEQKAHLATFTGARIFEMDNSDRNPKAWLRGTEAVWSQSHPNHAVFEARFKPVPDFLMTWGDVRGNETGSWSTLRGGRLAP